MTPLSDKQRTKNKYRAASKAPQVQGPGIWCTCPMGKEKQVIGELYDVLDSIGEELWPITTDLSSKDKSVAAMDAESDDEEEMDLETQLANELAAMKKPDKANKKRFKNIFIDTKCLAFISCRQPVDPVRLVLAYFEEIERTQRARTRNVLRLSPITATCPAHVVEIVKLAETLILPVFAAEPAKAYRYKIQTRIRNNNKLRSDAIIPDIAKCVPSDRGHVVDLENPEMVIMVEVYQAVCGISVVPDWCKYKRFNVIEYSQSLNRAETQAETLASDTPEVQSKSPT